jgi:hypothetical protein
MQLLLSCQTIELTLSIKAIWMDIIMYVDNIVRNLDLNIITQICLFISFIVNILFYVSNQRTRASTYPESVNQVANSVNQVEIQQQNPQQNQSQAQLQQQQNQLQALLLQYPPGSRMPAKVQKIRARVYAYRKYGQENMDVTHQSMRNFDYSLFPGFGLAQ